MPDEAIKKIIELEFPDQAAYMASNFLFYIIQTCLSLLICGGFFNPFLFIGAALINIGFSVYVTIWNFTQQSIVWNDMWEASEFDNAKLVMKWMWWLRTIPGCLVLCCCGCLVCVGVFGGGAAFITSILDHHK